jgi:hypothetical protein
VLVGRLLREEIMNPKRLIPGAAAALILTGAASVASAATYDFTFTQPGYEAASGTLTTSDTVNSVGGFDVTGVTGEIEGNSIAGLVANPNQPNPSTDPDQSQFTYDNVLFPTSSALVDTSGILIDVPIASFGGMSFPNGSSPYLISYNPGTADYELYANFGGGLEGAFALTPAGAGGSPVSAAPEPSSWALMLLGVGSIGYAFRRAKKGYGGTFARAVSV